MSRRLVLPVIVTAAIVAVATALTAPATSSITRPRLERSLPIVFSNLYVKQAAILGRSAITVASLDARAFCDKHGPKVPDFGPGGD